MIGTGNTPVLLVQSKSERDAFFDAPLAGLNSTNTDASNLTAQISPIASTSFREQFGKIRTTAGLNATQLDILRGQIQVAHDRGILVRYWDLPTWPIRTRNAIWRTLWDEGVDLINADDLHAAAGITDSAGDW